MPIATEDKEPLNISGDPPPTTPLTQKQVAGAQKAEANRTRQGPQAVAQPASPGQSNGKPEGEPEHKPSDQRELPGSQAEGQGGGAPIVGGVAQAEQTYRTEADQAIGFNPAHGQDWWKHAIESPVESFFFAKHVYNAYYNAFLDSSAVTRSVHDIWHQDNAVGWLLRNAVDNPVQRKVDASLPFGMAGSVEDTTANAAGMGLPAGADPTNILYAASAARGLALMARLLGPSVAAAIFENRHTPSDIAWAVLPAVLFGGKLPPSVSGKLEAAMPGVTKLFDKVSAVKLAQDESKAHAQQGEDLIQRILKTGAMGPKDEEVAPAWDKTMRPLTAAQENQLISSLREKYGSQIFKASGEFMLPGKQAAVLEEGTLKADMLERYGTLDVERLIPLLVRDGASVTTLRNVWTKLARMHYGLSSIAAGEGPLVDPLSHKLMLPQAVVAKIEDGYQWTAHMAQQAFLSPTGHDADANVSRIRNLIGHLRSGTGIEQQWIAHLQDVAGDQATNPREWDLLSRSIEPSGREAEVAYQSLSAEMKYVRDSIRLVAAAAGSASEELGMIQRVHGYLPRVGLVIKDAKGGVRRHRARQILTGESTAHRAQTVTFNEAGRMQIEQAYKTVKEANEAVARQRGYVSQAILSRTPWDDVLRETGAGVPATDIREIEQIQATIDSDPEAAKLAAEEYAKKLIPEFSENPFDALPKFGRQIRAITSRRAMTDLMNSIDKGGKSLAVATPTNGREVQKLLTDGYRPLRLAGFPHVMVNAQYADLLEHMAHLNSRKPPGWLEKILEAEGTAVSMIMFAPRIHGVNMAGRLAIAMSRFGPDIKEWVGAGMLQKGGMTSLPPLIPLVKGSDEITADNYRLIPQLEGLLPPNPGKGLGASGFAEKYIQHIADMVGDTDLGRVPLVRDMTDANSVAKASSGAKEVMGKVGNTLWGKQSELWQWVSDFGVMMYWVELAAALRSGRFETAARKAMEEAGTKVTPEELQRQTRSMAGRYAATRANSWMGHVTPEDTNPMLHAVLKSAFFAPNYWRTWGEILTGYYRNAGFGWSADTIKYVVENEIKTAAAAVLFQQLSANALNLAFSGHTIYQNDPGNWGKVEITQPWAIAAYNEYLKMTVKDPAKLKTALIDEKTGRDGKGAKLTWENPAARQMTDTEQAMGLLTTAPHWTPTTFLEGMSAFGAARTSPVSSAIAALGNIDLYRSISSDGLRFVDPNHDTVGGSPLADLITAAGDLTPFSAIGSSIQQQIMQGNVDSVNVLGVPVPKAVLDAFSPGSLAQDIAKAFLVGQTGYNPPFMRSARTQGVSPTDDQYKAVHEIQSDYQNKMNAASSAALSGQLPPYQWLAAYRGLSSKHSNELHAIFLHAPEYENGPLGLTNSYEALYDQATDKNGVLQPDKLRTLQHQWRQDHSQADYAAVENELHANDSKYPMLALYHKSQDAYYNWQADWCKENNVDLATLQSDMSGWSVVYNDRVASQQWVRDHPEITQFENAKKHDFEAGQSKYGEAGLMYALFFNPTAADRYLTTSGETAQQVEQQTQAEQVPPAP